MIENSGMPKAESGWNAAADRPRRANSIRHSSFVIRHFPRGLTLIELLVTIVIMVTVLAGVLPLVSPNNNSRKIREASRQLNSLLSQAQAQAARDGRPVGVAFREFANATSRSGMALEAYMISVPPAFAGFSEHSRVSVTDTGALYGPSATFTDPRFSPSLNGYKICQLEFWASGSLDAFPPRTLKIGDTVEVGGNIFLICDDEDQTKMPNQTELVGQTDSAVEYLLSDPTATTPVPGTVLNAIWLNYHGQQLPQVTIPPTGQAYAIRRQPVNTSDQPLQFPRGIGIDMQASGVEGAGSKLPLTFDEPGGADTVGVMFSPNGMLDVLYFDGARRDGVEQVFLLLGLIENGNGGSQDENDYDFTPGTSITDDELAQRRTRINWLNADSRWVAVNRAGRIITAENNISFNPRVSPFSDPVTAGTPREIRLTRMFTQLNHMNNVASLSGARFYAKQMSGSTGR